MCASIARILFRFSPVPRDSGLGIIAGKKSHLSGNNCQADAAASAAAAAASTPGVEPEI